MSFQLAGQDPRSTSEVPLAPVSSHRVNGSGEVLGAGVSRSKSLEQPNPTPLARASYIAGNKGVIPVKAPRPRVLGLAEVAETPGISKQALNLRRRCGPPRRYGYPAEFPTPLAELACGPVWLADEIEAYCDEEQRLKSKTFAARWSELQDRIYTT